MSEEITKHDTAEMVSNPVSGEVISLADPTDMLARFVADLDDLRQRLETERSQVNTELLERLDKNATWTFQAGGYKITAPSPDPGVEYDGGRLAAALANLADRGVIDTHAYEAAVDCTLVCKAKKRGINALLKLGGEIAEAIRGTEIESTPKARRVRVNLKHDR